MSVKLYLFITGLVLFGNAPSPEGFKTRNVLQTQLQDDLIKLNAFSNKMHSFGITSEKFEYFFFNGVRQAFRFHQKSGLSKSSNWREAFEKELLNNSRAKHPIKKSPDSPINLEKGIGTFNNFSGQWHGKWQQKTVRHLWLKCKNSHLMVDKTFIILGFQSCFTGDGFGWNYVIEHKEQTYLLGYVYHYQNGELIAENPHFALLNSDSQLTWVSNTHIYYEFISNETHFSQKKHYVINAMRYHLNNGKVLFSNHYQAVYNTMGN